MDGQAPDDAETTIAALRERLAIAERDLAAAARRETAQREGERFLRGELQHRVRNILSVVRSIFARTISGGDIEDIADHFRGRLDVLARYQARLLVEAQRGANLEMVLREELSSFRHGDDPRIAIDGPDVQLEDDVAQALALAAHELVTNSIKFGVLSQVDGRGTIAVEWRLAGERLTIDWEEVGVPVMARDRLHRGFGQEYIEDALPYQLGADTSFELRPGGVQCCITLNLKGAERSAGEYVHLP